MTTPPAASHAAHLRSAPVRVLVIEDDDHARASLRDRLERAGMTMIEAADGVAGLRALYRDRPDLILLDIGLPGVSGWTTLDRIREVCDVPVIMVSGYTLELEKVRALSAGADDYLTKPYGPSELLARIEAVLRRVPAATEPARGYADGLVEIDAANREARAAGRPLGLTPLELRLLTFFVRHPNQILSVPQLLENVWGADAYAPERVKIYVGYLRAKFRAQGVEPPIETVRGFGYKYKAQRASQLSVAQG